MPIAPFNKRFAMKLTAARVAARYETAAAMARALEIDVYRYRAWERGQNEPSLEMLKKLCEKTGQDANFFIMH